MSDIEEVIKVSKKIEGILRNQYKADGRGLHELVTSIQSKLDSELVRDLRKIATIRNHVIHQDGYNFNKDKNKFFQTSERVLSKLAKRQNINFNSPSSQKIVNKSNPNRKTNNDILAVLRFIIGLMALSFAFYSFFLNPKSPTKKDPKQAEINITISNH
jgi:hypothetical protein